MKHFPRKSLAEQVRKSISGALLLTDAVNGLFLAAPRRTGKSTFLREDLMPELHKHKIVAIYVDLWSDKSRDPALLITDAIAAAMTDNKGVFAKALSATKGGVTLGPITLDFDPAKSSHTARLSIPEALKEINITTGRQICLIIDEAQHALTSTDGENAMSALKSARDQMNSPGQVRLMLVMSGSDRDKLLRLVNTTGAAFWGSQITEMPELGADFVEYVAALVTSTYPQFAPVNNRTLSEAFRLFQNRPQFFTAAIEKALSPLSPLPKGQRFEESVLQSAKESVSRYESQLAEEYLSLTSLQQAIVERMLTTEGAFRPYIKSALAAYKKRTGKAVTQSKVQAALEVLRTRDEPLVWKSARGEYALSDAGYRRWYERLVRAKGWPPS